MSALRRFETSLKRPNAPESGLRLMASTTPYNLIFTDIAAWICWDWLKAESALTDYDHYLCSMTYFMRYTPDGNERSRKIAQEGLKRFPDSPLLKIRLAWTYLAESVNFGPVESCRETIEIAYNLGREAEDAMNKSRFLIYQNLKLMAHACAWRSGDFDRSIQQGCLTQPKNDRLLQNLTHRT